MNTTENHTYTTKIIKKSSLVWYIWNKWILCLDRSYLQDTRIGKYSRTPLCNLCLQVSFSVGPSIGAWLTYKSRAWEKLLFPASICCHSFFRWGWGFLSTSPCLYWDFFFPGLSLHGICAFCHHCCEILWLTDQLFGKLSFSVVIHHLLLLDSFHPFFHSDPWTLGGRSLM